MKIKTKELEKQIKQSIDEVRSIPSLCEDRFAILCEDDIEVQIVVTGEKDYFCDCVLPAYEEAEE